MIKEAFQYLVSLGKSEEKEIGGQTWSDKPLHLINEPTASPLQLSTLSGLTDYLKANLDGAPSVIVHVASPTSVVVTSMLNKDQERSFYLRVNAITPEFDFDSWYDTDSFNIKMQSCFKNIQSDDDKSIMLKVIGNIREEKVREYGDDGTSQSIKARVGTSIAGENVKIPNPVNLAPFRTFVEVDQPASDFVFRLKDGPKCALFEADGGKWKIEAVDNIRGFLEDNLSKEIKDGKVTIIS